LKQPCNGDLRGCGGEPLRHVGHSGGLELRKSAAERKERHVRNSFLSQDANQVIIDSICQVVHGARFRQDLYYRLRVVEITVPSLRQRRDDILPIARQFLAGAAKRFGKRAPALSPEAANLLLRYPWPGNVRELENAVERALALAQSDRIGVDDLPPELGAAAPTVQTADDVRTLAEVERDYIAAALRASGGNRAKAAEKLGIGPATLYRKLKQVRP